MRALGVRELALAVAQRLLASHLHVSRLDDQLLAVYCDPGGELEEQCSLVYLSTCCSERHRNCTSQHCAGCAFITAQCSSLGAHLGVTEGRCLVVTKELFDRCPRLVLRASQGWARVADNSAALLERLGEGLARCEPTPARAHVRVLKWMADSNGAWREALIAGPDGALVLAASSDDGVYGLARCPSVVSRAFSCLAESGILRDSSSAATGLGRLGYIVG